MSVNIQLMFCGFFLLSFLSLSVRWNQLDLAIVLLSIVGITLEEIEMNAALPINPTIIRIMRVLRIARGTACSVGLQPSLQTHQETVWPFVLLVLLLQFGLKPVTR